MMIGFGIKLFVGVCWILVVYISENFCQLTAYFILIEEQIVFDFLKKNEIPLVHEQNYKYIVRVSFSKYWFQVLVKAFLALYIRQFLLRTRTQRASYVWWQIRLLKIYLDIDLISKLTSMIKLNCLQLFYYCVPIGRDWISL